MYSVHFINTSWLNDVHEKQYIRSRGKGEIKSPWNGSNYITAWNAIFKRVFTFYTNVLQPNENQNTFILHDRRTFAGRSVIRGVITREREREHTVSRMCITYIFVNETREWHTETEGIFCVKIPLLIYTRSPRALINVTHMSDNICRRHTAS